MSSDQRSVFSDTDLVGFPPFLNKSVYALKRQLNVVFPSIHSPLDFCYFLFAILGFLRALRRSTLPTQHALSPPRYL